MLSRLHQHHAFLSALRQDGWTLVEPVTNDFACLANAKPAEQRSYHAVAAWEATAAGAWRSVGSSSPLAAPFPPDSRSGFSTD